jgi:hypothetical protein
MALKIGQLLVKKCRIITEFNQEAESNADKGMKFLDIIDGIII